LTYVKELINLIQYSENLKNVNRSGWKLAGVESSRKESVAEHSYGSVMIAIYLAQELKARGEDLNFEKTMLMAALHDLPESITGDIARTAEFLEKEENAKQKDAAERKAITTILNPLGESFHYLKKLWIEYNERDSIEAKIVRAADILDMLVHARALEKSGTSPKMLQQFFISSQPLIESLSINLVTEIFKELCEAHEEEFNYR
jgi:putative hydrolase of HD superfamily